MGSKLVKKKREKRDIKPVTGGWIEIRGARQNNLKGVDLDLPLGKLTVITGPSGSGKSSLAFDTIYAEGQRRYVETFSPYMRQFLDRMDKPRVDDIHGIPPAIAVEQSNPVKSSRSTVGTITEINDYLKLLWPRVAHAFCPELRPGDPARNRKIDRRSDTQSFRAKSRNPGRDQRYPILAPALRPRIDDSDGPDHLLGSGSAQNGAARFLQFSSATRLPPGLDRWPRGPGRYRNGYRAPGCARPGRPGPDRALSEKSRPSNRSD